MDGKAYRGLRAWQVAMDLLVETYRMTECLPGEERWNYRAQLRSAARSVPANIAEGYGRVHRGDYVRHLSIARGSLMELETDVIALVRLKLLSREQATPVWRLAQSVG